MRHALKSKAQHRYWHRCVACVCMYVCVCVYDTDRRPGDSAGPSGAMDPALPVSSPASTGSTLLNSTDPYYKEFRDLPYHMAITRYDTL